MRNEAINRHIHVTFVYSYIRNYESVRNTALDFPPSLWVRPHVLPRCSWGAWSGLPAFLLIMQLGTRASRSLASSRGRSLSRGHFASTARETTSRVFHRIRREQPIKRIHHNAHLLASYRHASMLGGRTFTFSLYKR